MRDTGFEPVTYHVNVLVAPLSLLCLETIRDKAVEALEQIETPPERRSMRWHAEIADGLSISLDPFRWRRLGDVQDAKAPLLSLVRTQIDRERSP